MSLLIESIKVLNGRIYKRKLHEARLNATRKTIFQAQDKILLKDHLHIPNKFRTGLYKCRVIYGNEIEHIEFKRYHFKKIRSAQIVHADIEYQHKYLDRMELDTAFGSKGNNDDIIIIKNGLVTDSYYCNLAFLKNNKWYTPASPLLKGTMRRYLVDNKKIHTRHIPIDNIEKYSHVSFFNALIPFKRIIIPVSAIHDS